jgi:two-component system LytT family sensor kinase
VGRFVHSEMMDDRPGLDWKKWRAMAGLYMVTNLAFIVQRVSFDLRQGAPLEIVNSLLDLAVFAGLWILFAIPIIRLTAGRALTPGNIALYFGAGIVLSLLHGALYLLFAMSIPGLMTEGQIHSVEDYLVMLAGLGHAWRFLSFGFLVVVSHAYDYYVLSVEREKRAAQLQVQLTEARLEALRTQIRPHFLFNTLNAITVLVDENPAAAKRTLAQLSELLRLTLENVHTQEVPLRREMEFLDHYLLIQQTRYGDRLSVRKAIGPDALDASVPYLVLQPLVENALKHGIDSLPGPGTITISARREGAKLVLGVLDAGEGRRNAAQGGQGMGIGLSNTGARLRQLYGADHSVSIGPAPGGNGTNVVVTLPFRDAAAGGVAEVPA